jgi:hypothetical protein
MQEEGSTARGVATCRHSSQEVPTIAPNMPDTASWRSVTWPQRALLIGVVATVLVFAMRPMPTGIGASSAASELLWTTFLVNALLLLVLGSAVIITTRRWFRHSSPLAPLRRQRRAVRRRAVFLGLIAYAAHQTLVVFLDPRFSLERLMGRRRVFGPVVAVADRVELAWAFTALAIGYVIVAWLLWRGAGVADLAPTDASPPRQPAVLESLPPLVAPSPSPPMLEALPRDRVTGRVIRQFDLSS